MTRDADFVARSTVEGILANTLGEKWRYAASYHRGIVATVKEAEGVFPAETISQTKAAIKAAWPQQCDEEYAIAKAYSRCSSRLFGSDGVNHAAIDARNSRLFESTPRIDAACPFD